MGVKFKEINLVLIARPVCESLKKWGESRWEATEEVQVDGERGWSVALSSPLPDSAPLVVQVPAALHGPLPLPRTDAFSCAQPVGLSILKRQ